MTYKIVKKYILILIILIIIFIILNFYKSNKKIFEDIMIFGLWNNNMIENQYEITTQDIVEIDVFTTINNKIYEKIAPGSKGNFIIKFNRPANTNYRIKINEKTSKPRNLVFILENNRYTSIKEMEQVINEKFLDSEKLIINWEWEYHISEIHDIQDTKDGKNAPTYIFQIESII